MCSFYLNVAPLPAWTIPGAVLRFSYSCHCSVSSAERGSAEADHLSRLFLVQYNLQHWLVVDVADDMHAAVFALTKTDFITLR